MPISRAEVIPHVVDLVTELNPSSILDVGVGFGHWGVLFRTFTDIRGAEVQPDRYGNWQVRIVGIEIFEAYRNPVHDVYSQVHYGDARQVMAGIEESFDLVFLGDVIEHFEKSEGRQVLKQARQSVVRGGLLVVTTPRYFRPQSDVLGNRHERHLSFWEDEELAMDHVEHFRYQKVGSWRRKQVAPGVRPGKDGGDHATNGTSASARTAGTGQDAEDTEDAEDV